MSRDTLTDKKVLARLKKATGQLEALSRMIENDTDCEKVMIQFQAAEAAVESAFVLFLGQNLKRCMHGKQEQNLDRIVRQLIKH